MRQLRHALEALIVYVLFAVFWLLPTSWASWLGGALLQLVGPLLPVSKIARHNLEKRMPELSEAARKRVLRGMWNNLGRTVAEFAHLPRLTGAKFQKHVEVIGVEHLERAQKEHGGFITFSAHMANWEIAPKTGYESGYELCLIYRKGNNPWLERLIRWCRKKTTEHLFTKGKQGAIAIARFVKSGGSVGMLLDQKMNDGIAVPFFGEDAMTAPAAADFSRKYNLPLIPAQVERLGGAQFRVTIYPPIRDTDSRDSLDVMTEVNALFEQWIRQRPEQWLWIHNRWPRDS